MFLVARPRRLCSLAGCGLDEVNNVGFRRDSRLDGTRIETCPGVLLESG